MRPWELEGDNEWLRYWEYAAPHRDTLTEMILANALDGANVCVWGAGSCHDLDLKRLTSGDHEVTLVDVNTQNIAWGVEYQLGSQPTNLRSLSPVDLSGLWRREATAGEPDADRRSLIQTLRHHQAPALGSYDLIVSAGMLSQVILDVVDAATTSNGQRAKRDATPPIASRASSQSEIVSALIVARQRHLGLMLDHLKPGGTALLIVDLVNSDDAPDIVTTEDLEATVARSVAAAPYSHVLDPEHLKRDLLRAPMLAKRVSEVAMSGFWRWRMTERYYACYAMRFIKQLLADDRNQA